MDRRKEGRKGFMIVRRTDASGGHTDLEDALFMGLWSRSLKRARSVIRIHDFVPGLRCGIQDWRSSGLC